MPQGQYLAELAAMWIAQRVSTGELQGRSAEVERSRLQSLVRLAPDAPPEWLDDKMIEKWQIEIGRHAPTSRRMYHSTIRGFCRWLVSKGHLESDPTAELRKVKEPRRAPRALNGTEVAQVLVACPDRRWRAIAALMVTCGLRCVEVSRLDYRDIDPQKLTVFVKGKFGSERVLPIPLAARVPLFRYLERRGHAPGPLFQATGSRARTDGRLSPAWISRKIARIMHDAGVHEWRDGRSAHALRHTCLSDVLDTCHDVRVVQEIAGHASLSTTQIYLRRANLDRMREAMEGRSYESVS